MPELVATIVVPCRHEEGNVGPLLTRLARALAGRQCEVLFVDDSDNEATVVAIRATAARMRRGGIELAVFRRAGPQRWGGLAGAVIDGLRLARSDRIVVMDADLQHPPELVPDLLDRLDGAPARNGDGPAFGGGADGDLQGAVDVVVGSRYVAGGDRGEPDGLAWRLLAAASTYLTKCAFPVRLRGVSDPTTGFFAVDRGALDVEALRSRGTKVLLEILVRSPGLRRAELPLIVAARHEGGERDGARHAVAYARQLPRLRVSTFATGRAYRYLGRTRLRDFALAAAVLGVFGAVLLEVLIRGGMGPLVAFGVQLVATLAISAAYNYLSTWRDPDREALGGKLVWFLTVRASTQFLSWLVFACLTLVGGLPVQVANLICVTAAAFVNYYGTDKVVFSGAQHTLPPVGQVFGRFLVAGSATVALGLGLFSLRLSGSEILAISVLAVALFNTVIGTLEVRWRLYGWRTPEAVQQMRWPERDEAAERISVIVPALDEAKVIGDTLRRILCSDHPDFEVIVSLCHGDDATLAEVRRVMNSPEARGRIRTVIRSYAVPNKPRQLNAALADCSGSVVGVVDAEDDIAAGLLSRVDSLFTSTGADVVQGGIALMTLGRSPSDWFKVHNVLEYFFWFTSRVFYQVMCGFVPLAGNTVFIRRDLMVEAGGWPDNLTEDCALGVLLCSRYGAKVVAAYEPELVTREEVPQTIHNRAKGSLFWQRVRWNQGFLSVLLEGDWLRLPKLGQRVLAGYILLTPFLQALSGLLLPLALLTVFSLKVPVGVAMLMYAPFLPVFLTVVVQVIALGEFARSYGQKVTARHYAFLLLGAPFYQWILMGAALWAVVRHVQGDTNWHKTEHSGHHRDHSADRTTDLAPILTGA